jgi:biotin transport system substrate-specific component
MLRTLPQTRDLAPGYRLAGIALFALLAVVSARLTIPLEPVPITLQVLVALLSGLVLGGRDGALSQLLYLSLIALNLPVDARMIGAAALLSPTAGYLIGFVPAAFVTGWLIEHSQRRMMQRWLASIVGILVIYAVGLVLLKLNTGMTWETAWAAGVVPFIGLDLGKAIIAAALAESGRTLLLRQV